MTSSPTRARGFTLIELMITVVIVAILASIAIPNYNAYVLKSHRVEAKTALLDMASLEERFFSTNNAYTTLASNLGYGGATDLSATSLVVGSQYYQVSMAPLVAAAIAQPNIPATPASFSITAVPVPGGLQVKDTACATFTVTSAGLRTAKDSSGADATSACW